MIQEIEYLSVMPDSSFKANASVIFIEDVMFDGLFIFGVRHRGGVITRYSDARVAQL